MLVTAAGLFIQGARRAAEADPGFPLDGGVVLELDPSLGGRDEAQGRETYRALVERARSLPGVQSASLASIVPFGMFTFSRSVAPAGQPLEGEGVASAIYTAVGRGYFDTLGLAVLRGRDFTAAEEQDASGPEGGPRGRAPGQETLARPGSPGPDPPDRRARGQGGLLRGGGRRPRHPPRPVRQGARASRLRARGLPLPGQPQPARARHREGPRGRGGPDAGAAARGAGGGPRPPRGGAAHPARPPRRERHAVGGAHRGPPLHRLRPPGPASSP